MTTPPVVLLHGLGGSPAVWDRVRPLLEHTPVTAPRLVHPAGIGSEADAVAADLGRHAPTVVVGHSRGGLVATALAERHPHLVAHLVLVNTPPTTASRRGSGGERLLGLPLLGPVLWRAMPSSLAAQGLSTAFAPGHDVPAVFVRDLRATGHGPFLAASRAIDEYLSERPLLERLTSLDQAVDVVLGRQDGRVDLGPYDDDERLRVTSIEAAGHTPPWEAPAAVAAVITDAVRRNGGRP